MCLIGEAVLEGAGAAFECFDDARSYEDGAEGRVTAGDSLPDQDNVWLDVPVLDCERFAGAAHAAHDFVGDEENAAEIMSGDRKSTRLNSSHTVISYAVFCLKKKKKNSNATTITQIS